MTRALACIALSSCLIATLSMPVSARAPHHRPRHHRRIVQAPAEPATPDCRYPDGTPFDPDIIGGQNHVGDGGPAVNLGGFSPCGY